VFIEAKDDRGGGDIWTTGTTSLAKLQSNHHHQQTNIQLIEENSLHCMQWQNQAELPVRVF